MLPFDSSPPPPPSGDDRRAATAPPTLEDARALLRRVFGHPQFRGAQEQVVATLLDGGDALVVWPTGTPLPPSSNLNFDPDEWSIAAAGGVRLGTGGQIDATGLTGTHLIVDVVGYLR